MFVRPGMLIFTLVATIWDEIWLWKIWIYVFLIFIFYSILLVVIIEIHRRNSRKKGLRFYFATAIHPAFLRLMLRKRVVLPEYSTCYILHVDDKVRRHSIRDAIRDMHADIQKLQDDWGENAVFIGNTFADLGSRERKWMEQFAEVKILEGRLIPFHPLLFRMFLKGHQRRVFGRAFRMKPKKWKIIILTQRSVPIRCCLREQSVS